MNARVSNHLRVGVNHRTDSRRLRGCASARALALARVYRSGSQDERAQAPPKRTQINMLYVIRCAKCVHIARMWRANIGRYHGHGLRHASKCLGARERAARKAAQTTPSRASERGGGFVPVNVFQLCAKRNVSCNNSDFTNIFINS